MSEQLQPNEEPANPPAIQNDANKEEAHPSPTSAIIEGGTEPGPGHASKADNHQEKPTRNWWEIFERTAKIFEAAAFIAAILTAWFIYEQMKGEEETRRLDERAWVAPLRVAVETSKVWTNNSVFKLYFKNTGKSPALNVSFGVNSCITLNQVPTDDPVIQTNSMMLAPDGESFMTLAEPKELVDRVVDGDMPFCIYGRIVYDDIFGAHHWTQFCWWADGSLEFRPSNIHNTCDEAKASKQ